MKIYHTDVLVVGAGPSGMLMSLLLANQGHNVLVVESAANFEREFRGEMLQPHFLLALKQINLLSFLEQYAHLKIWSEEHFLKRLLLVDMKYGRYCPEQPYALWMSQPEFLEALHVRGRKMPTFDLWFRSSPKEMIREGEQIVGAIVERGGERIEVRAKITIGTDGRHSTVRKIAGYEMEYEYYEKDRIWFTTKLPTRHNDRRWFVHTDKYMFLMLPKIPDMIQGGFTLMKGEWKNIQERGIEEFKKQMRQAPDLVEFADSLTDFRPFYQLRARILFVKEWAKNGCLLVGDSAHCASPVGAIGIAMSAGSALVATDVVHEALQTGDYSKEQLGKVQAQRSPYVRRIHEIQKRAETAQTTPMNWKKRIYFYALSVFSRTPLIHPFLHKNFWGMLETIHTNPALALPDHPKDAPDAVPFTAHQDAEQEAAAGASTIVNP